MMICPLRYMFDRCPMECQENDCAWWCEWAKCCAMVAIPAEISDRAHDIMQKIEG